MNKSHSGCFYRMWLGDSVTTGPSVRHPPLLLLHGLSGTSWDWIRTVLRMLHMERTVVAMDLPGYGYSSWIGESERYSVELWAKAVGNFATEIFGSDPFVLVGHSLGGKIALQVAAEGAHNVERMLLVDSGPSLGRGHVGEHAFPTIAAALSAYRPRYEKEAEDVYLVRMEDYLEKIQSGVRIRRDPRIATEYVNGDIGDEQEKLWNIWENLRLPLYVIRGGASKVLSPERLAEMLARNEMASRTEIAGSGHNIPSEAPEALAVLMSRILHSHRVPCRETGP